MFFVYSDLLSIKEREGERNREDEGERGVRGRDVILQ